jgi:hypothetical protein
MRRGDLMERLDCNVEAARFREALRPGHETRNRRGTQVVG